MTSPLCALTALLASGEPSKVPFYIAGALLVVWATLVAVFGIRSPEFPGSRMGGRAVMAVSAVLVAAAVTTSIVTAGKPANAHAQGASEAPTQGATPTPAGAAATTPAPGAPAGGSAPAAAGSLAIAADPSGQLKFDKKSLSAKAGKVTVAFTNASPVPHNFTIQAAGKNVAATKTFAGGKQSVSATLKPGNYVFLCTVPGHAQAGMKGTLTVK